MKDYIDNDAWSAEYFDEFFGAQDLLSQLDYEFRNCVRKSSLDDIEEELENAINQLQNQLNTIRNSINEEKAE